MSKMNKQFYIVNLLCLLFLPFGGLAQKLNNTLYFFHELPQANRLNPAIQPKCKIFVGFPALSSVYVNYSNSSFAYKDAIVKGKGIRSDSLEININTFHNALRNTNFISQQVEMGILAFGLKIQNNYFSLDVTTKEDARLSFNKELISFLKDGNYNYMGRNVNLGGLHTDASAYHEIAFGYSRKLNEKWNIGFKTKLLFGISNLRMETSELSAFTSLNGNRLVLHSKHRLKTSLPIHQIVYDNDGFVDELNFNADDFDQDFFLNVENPGVAFDFGMSYQVNQETVIYASILDVGGISWKSNTREFYQDAHISYKGADWSQSGNPNNPNYKTIKEVFKELSDDIEEQFKVRDLEESYFSGLPVKMYFGLACQASNRWRIGALSRTELFRGKIKPALSLSANAKILNNVALACSYNIANNSYANFGLGLSLKTGVMQIYALTDNLIAAFTPKHTQTLNLRFGINFLFGCKTNKKKKNDPCLNQTL